MIESVGSSRVYRGGWTTRRVGIRHKSIKVTPVTPREYTTVFEIGFRSFPWSALINPLFFALLGFVFYGFSKQQIRQVVGVVVFGMGLIFFLIISTRLIPDFARARSEYVNGQSSVVEGTITDFRPMPDLGPSEESFSVGGVRFSYYVGDWSPCFNNSPRRKGPARAGLNVRIYYRDTCIQRVDIQR